MAGFRFSKLRGEPKNPRKVSDDAVPAAALAGEAGSVGAMAGSPAIGEREVMRATEILKKYKAGKANLEKKLIANEEFWKLRQWSVTGGAKEDEFTPATPWLWSCIQSRYSDAMDSYPTCNMRPRQADDKAEAKMLSSIIPVILEQNDFEGVYSDVTWYTLKHGGGIYGVFWDGSKCGGLGDVTCKKIDFLNLFWEPGICDIQKSANVFHTELISNDLLVQRYPELDGKLGGKNVTVAHYIYDEHIDTADKSVVVDWYYHTEYGGKRQLQYCKYVGNIVLFATENETSPTSPSEMGLGNEEGAPSSGAPGALRGWYDHGMYPFVVQSLYPIEGSICGYGLTDIGRDTQIEIDYLNRAITKNSVIASTPRWFVRADGSINEEEYADLSRDFVHCESGLGEDDIRQIQANPLSSTYVEVLRSKIDELKYCTSNQDVTNGSAPTGITAASALAALQETAGKNARSSNKVFYRAYREVIYQIIELIRQFYDVPRRFRIAGDSGVGEQFVTYSNAGIRPKPQISPSGADMGLRLPEFDIEVTTEKANPYKKMEINELALQFYNLGFFNPQMGDQAAACIGMMDFDHKDDILLQISQNASMFKALCSYQQLALSLAQKYEPESAEKIANMILSEGGQPMPQGTVDPRSVSDSGGEHPMVEKSRSNARASTEAD